MSAAFTQMIAQLLAETVAEMPVTTIPYAVFLGLHVQVRNNILIVRMPFDLKLVGNPQPQRLHGGVIGGLLEFTGALTVARAMAIATPGADIPIPKPLNISLDYLRAGAPQDTFASASITRLGRRVANVRADAWQSTRDTLITAAHMNVILG
jgi:acyl-coenzyme A thioesterase PaaI-like protein